MKHFQVTAITLVSTITETETKKLEIILDSMCKEEMKELNINIENVENMTKSQCKKFLTQSIEKAALNYLKEKQSKQSKGKEIYYHNLKTQSYLSPKSKLSVSSMQKIFQLRSRNLPVKKNFPNCHSDTKCVVTECQDEDSQEGLFLCKYLGPWNQVIERNTKYEDIVLDDVIKQMQIVKIIDQKFQSRIKYLASKIP